MITETNIKAVRRIVVLQPNPDGGYTPLTVYRKKKSKRKKGSRLLRPIEKRARRLTKGLAAATTTYSKRHRRSNSKKRNGWLRDMGKNVRKAANDGRKEMKIRRVI